MSDNKLSFCTRCGHAVEPYPSSHNSNSNYWCSNCNRTHEALDFETTGYLCSKCNNIVPLYAQCCGYCGAPSPYS
jgi:hypothetical protein